jgi:glycosyltransferase involved in cell wall biosynthesis
LDGAIVVIRLYGTTRENGSFARVTEGMRTALDLEGALAGFVPVDAYDQETEYPGWDAETAVYVGRQAAVGLMTTIGDHKRRYVLLPPNSTWVPEDLLVHVAKHATHLLAPSPWAEEILRPYAAAHGLRTSLWLHGIDTFAFGPSESAAAELLNLYRSGCFWVLHLTSTEAQRKGTRELVTGWIEAVRAGAIGARPKLAVVGNPYEGGRLRTDVERLAADFSETVVWGSRGGGMTPSDARRVYQIHHIVCQPSRAEGFGLVPLEALASGVPIVATDCTGHAAYVGSDPGVVVVSSGELAPIDDGPGARAPSVTPAAIAGALTKAYAEWPSLMQATQRRASAVREAWSWKAVTQDWLRRNQ